MTAQTTYTKKNFLNKEKYLSCEIFAKQTGLNIDEVKTNFTTNYKGNLVVPIFMLNQASPKANLNLAVNNELDMPSCDQLVEQPSGGNKKMNNKYQIDIYQIDCEYEDKVLKFAESDDDEISNEKNSHLDGLPNVHGDKKRRRKRKNNSKVNAIMIASILVLFGVGILFITQYPPANKFIMSKLIDFNVIRSM